MFHLHIHEMFFLKELHIFFIICMSLCRHLLSQALITLPYAVAVVSINLVRGRLSLSR